MVSALLSSVSISLTCALSPSCFLSRSPWGCWRWLCLSARRAGSGWESKYPQSQPLPVKDRCEMMNIKCFLLLMGQWLTPSPEVPLSPWGFEQTLHSPELSLKKSLGFCMANPIPAPPPPPHTLCSSEYFLINQFYTNLQHRLCLWGTQSQTLTIWQWNWNDRVAGCCIIILRKFPFSGFPLMTGPASFPCRTAEWSSIGFQSGMRYKRFLVYLRKAPVLPISRLFANK